MIRRPSRLLVIAGLAVVVAIGLIAAGWYILVRSDDTDALGNKPLLGKLPSEGPQPAATPGTHDPDLLLPDLHSLPPENLQIETDARAGTRQIRFSTTTINTGAGPLDMRGTSNPATGRTRATQRIVSRVADGVVERVAGEAGAPRPRDRVGGGAGARAPGRDVLPPSPPADALRRHGRQRSRPDGWAQFYTGRAHFAGIRYLPIAG